MSRLIPPRGGLPGTAARLAAVVGIGLAAACGCGPPSDAPLPSTDDPWAHAVAVAERARRLTPGEPARGLFNLARAHERFGKEDQALELYRQTVEADPAYGEAHRRMAFILSQRKDRMTEAISAYQKSLACEPGQPGVLTRIGLVLSHMGKQEEAIQAFSDEIRAGTADAETHYNLGQSLALQGKHQEAVKGYNEALAKAADMRSAWYSLAQSLRVLGKKDEADAAQKRFLELKAKEDQAAAAAPADDSGRRQALRGMSETWLDAASLIAIVANRTTEPPRRAALEKEHVVALGEAVRIDPSFGEARTLQVTYLERRRELLAAARSCEEGLPQVDDATELTLKAYQVAGDLLTRSGDGPEARASQETALRLLRTIVAASPAFHEAHLEIAKTILFHLRDQGELLPLAATHAQRAVELDGGPRSYDVLAYAYHQGGRPDLALRTLEAGVARHPGDSLLVDRLEAIQRQVAR